MVTLHASIIKRVTVLLNTKGEEQTAKEAKIYASLLVHDRQSF